MASWQTVVPFRPPWAMPLIRNPQEPQIPSRQSCSKATGSSPRPQDVSVSIPEWKDLENSEIFQYVALDFFGSVNLTGSAQPTRIALKGVTPNYFAMLGVGAQLARTFDEFARQRVPED
jgi:hypothetical protein